MHVFLFIRLEFGIWQLLGIWILELGISDHHFAVEETQPSEWLGVPGMDSYTAIPAP
jgi:hypothetical protein